MSTPEPITPATRPRRPPARAWRPDRRVLWWALGAFLAGLVVFAFVIRDAGDDDFFRANGVPPTSAERRYEPLPAPLPAGEGAGIREPEAPTQAPRDVVIEPEPAPAPPPEPVAEAPREERPRPVEASSREARPLPGQTPPPDYPVRALSRGEGGTVLVIVHIGPDGVPTATQLAQSSGSRDLDRAAQAAVRRWRFEPAMADGRPTVGRVVVPIDFRPR